VKNKQKSYYCYSEEERNKAITQMKSTVEITRFKGLGEISPEEFRNFIGEDMRLEQVAIFPTEQIQEMLKFYMGKNTMERQDFIINNLVIEEDIADFN
jgi:topoisomerase-4 subunit B